MNTIELFKNPEFGEVRVVEVDNEPYFVGKDVAEVLGYKNPSKAIKDHCDEDNYKVLTYKALNETLLASLWNSNDYSNKVIINEFGVYELVLGSELPSAKAFRKWITSEVLPSIRKNGAYMTEKTLERALAEPDFLIQLAQQLKEEKTKRLELEKDNKILKPKADYFDDLVDRNLLINFRDFAKELNVRQKYLIEWLISNRYIYRNEKGKIKSYSKYSEGDSRLFEVKEYKATNNSHSGTQTLITPRGRETFRLLIPRQQDLDI